MEPARLSRELRHGTSDDLRRRRWIYGLSLFGAAMGGVVGAYQLGLIRRLPDPPLPDGLDVLDSERVDASDYAYKRLDTPDGLLMIGTYAVTAALAGAGGEHRAREAPWLPLAMATKIAYDVTTNVTLAMEEWEENGALCTYCQTASLASIASLALALPEAARAATGLLGGGQDGDGAGDGAPSDFPAPTVLR